MSGPSQPKVVDEDWSDDRVKGYLDLTPYDDTHPDFYVLEKAYRGMVASDFQRFIGYFKAAGRDLNARNSDGETLQEIIVRHPRSQAYLACFN